MPNDHVIRLSPRQMAFVRNANRYALAHGGRGGGKTYALCAKLVSRASAPGAREGLYRKRLIDLRGTTLVTLLDGDGGLPPVLPPGTYRHNKIEKIIRLIGGGEIVYNGLDQGTVSRQAGGTGKASSRNLTGAAFDEMVEATEADFLQVGFSVRLTVPGVANQIYGACNPGPPSHWIARRFGLTNAAPMEGHVSHPINAADNRHLPKSYIEALDSLEGVARARYRDGLWVGSDGMVYDQWDRTIHATKHPPHKPIAIGIGVDEGYNDPFAVVVVHQFKDGSLHVAKEIYATKWLRESKVAKLQELYTGKETVVVDSAEPEFITTLQRAGIPAEPATKGKGSVFQGIQVIQQLLSSAKNGQQGLTVNEMCVAMIREMESYEWKPAGTMDAYQDEPMDANNHTMDALRYIITRMLGTSGAKVVATPAAQVMSDRRRRLAEERMWTRT